MAGRGGGASDLQAFFKSLPNNELLPQELALRQALLDFVQLRTPQTFPLSEWIDRRVGGEFQTRKNESGQLEVYKRGSNPPPPEPARAAGPEKEVFFASLDPNGFSKEEEALRDMIFEFLAKWKHRDLANLANLNSDPEIKRRCGFLPGRVSLKEWVEQRIGAEVQFKSDNKSADVIHLSPAARPFVTAKYAELSKSVGGAAPPAPTRPGAAAPPAQTPPPPGRQAGPKPVSKDAFFSGLPKNELSAGELGLRNAVMELLDNWAKRKGPNVCPVIGDVNSDAKTRKIMQGFLPPSVNLDEWIDRRIGGEIEVRKRNGRVEVLKRGAGGPAGPADKKEDKAAQVDSEEFLDTLPSDEHSPEEAELRQAILDYLEGHGAPVALVDASKDVRIKQCRTGLLPESVTLRSWVDRRIGGEVEVLKNAQGRYMIKLRSLDASADADAPVDTDELKELWFADLPADGFSPGEEQLREALMNFLSAWRRPDPPTLTNAEADGKVKMSRAKVLSKDSPVSLQEWIDRRIGGEVEMDAGPNGQTIFGIRGELHRGKKRPGEPAGGPPYKRR